MVLDNEWRFNHKIDYIYALRYIIIIITTTTTTNSIITTTTIIIITITTIYYYYYHCHYYSSVFCVCCGALAAGLTVGLLSLDALKLKIRLVTGTKKEKVYYY